MNAHIERLQRKAREHERETVPLQYSLIGKPGWGHDGVELRSSNEREGHVDAVCPECGKVIGTAPESALSNENTFD